MHYYAWMDGPAVFLFIKNSQKKHTKQHIYIYINPEIFCLGFLPKNNACLVQTSPWTSTKHHPPPVLGSGVPGAAPKFRGKVCAKRGDPRGDCKGLGGLSNNSRVELWSMMPAKHTTFVHQNGGAFFCQFTASQLLFHQFIAGKQIYVQKRWRPWWGFFWRGHVRMLWAGLMAAKFAARIFGCCQCVIMLSLATLWGRSALWHVALFGCIAFWDSRMHLKHDAATSLLQWHFQQSPQPKRPGETP